MRDSNAEQSSGACIKCRRLDLGLRMQALKRGRWQDLRYRGHPMRRPIASNEVAWLARLLVRASDALNAALGIDQAHPGETAEQGIMQVDHPFRPVCCYSHTHMPIEEVASCI